MIGCSLLEGFEGGSLKYVAGIRTKIKTATAALITHVASANPSPNKVLLRKSQLARSNGALSVEEMEECGTVFLLLFGRASSGAKTLPQGVADHYNKPRGRRNGTIGE